MVAITTEFPCISPLSAVWQADILFADNKN